MYLTGLFHIIYIEKTTLMQAIYSIYEGNISLKMVVKRSLDGYLCTSLQLKTKNSMTEA